jgi:hypothetical protein
MNERGRQYRYRAVLCHWRHEHIQGGLRQAQCGNMNSVSNELPKVYPTLARKVQMKRFIIFLTLAGLLGGCAGPVPRGIEQTRSMTDMDGRPIAPASSGIGGIGVGIGSWGGRSGASIGFGMGW